MPNPADVAWDDWLLLAIQLMTLVFLVVYVWKTWEMASGTRRAAEAAEATLKEARESRIEEMAPAILVYFDSSPWLGAEIVIENAGRGAAADVSLHFEPPLQSTQPHETDKFFKATQSLIPPGYRITQMFDAWPTLLESDLPKRYEVTVHYHGVQTGRLYEVEHRLDAEALRHRFVGRRKGLNEIAEELEKWRRTEETKQRQRDRKEYEQLFKGPADLPLARDGEEAVQFMVGHWVLQRHLQSAPETFVPMLPLVSALRSDLLTVFRFLPSAAFSEQQMESLRHLSAPVFSREAEMMGGGKKWMEKVDQEMRVVEELFVTA